MQAQGIGDVVEDAHGEGRGLLEDHADAAAEGEEVGLGVEDVLAVEEDLALGALAAVEGVDAVVGAQVGGFAAAGGADDGGDLALGDVQVVVKEGLVAAFVEEGELAGADLDLGFLLGVHKGVILSASCRGRRRAR